MRVFFLFACSLSLSCVNTLLEVKGSQFSKCESLCKRYKGSDGAGIDWWSGEKTCVCKNGIRIRLAETYGEGLEEFE